MASKAICCVPNCGATKEHLHKFPNPTKEHERFTTWLLNIGGDILHLNNEFIYNNRRVCNLHFDVKYHTRSKFLSCDAVPELYLPGSFVRKPLMNITHQQVLENPTEELPPNVSTEGQAPFNKPTEMDTFTMDTNYGECRCCLARGNHRDIRKEYYYNGVREVYIDIFKESLNLNLSRHPDLTTLICSRCVIRLRDACSFRMMSASTERQLLTRLEDNHTVFVNVDESNIIELEVKNEPVMVKEEVSENDGYSSDFVAEDSHEDPETSNSLSEAEAALVSRHARVKPLPRRDNLRNICPDYIRQLDLLSHPSNEVKDDTSNSKSDKSLETFDSNAAILKSVQKMEDQDIENEKAKNKQKSIEKENEWREMVPDELQKIIQHRGVGPILRKNSLKLISNSTICIFQWYKSQYRCFCCKKPFSSIDLLRKHTKTHKIEEIEKIIIYSQNNHVKVDISKLFCTICNRKLDNLDELCKHLTEHDILVKKHMLIPYKIEDELKCQFCYKTFSKFRLLNIHMNKYYQNYICHICGQSFSNNKYLVQHNIRKHNPVKCNLCGIICKTLAEKKIHENKTHGVKKKRIARHPCQYCDQRFYQEATKIKHLVEIHGEKKPELFCNMCDKVYITKSILNAHKKISHFKVRKFECETCIKSFFTNSDLTRHKLTHLRVKNFKCGICNNMFSSKVTLRRHIKRIHSTH